MRTRRSASSSSDPVSSSIDMNRGHHDTSRQEGRSRPNTVGPSTSLGVKHTPVILHETLELLAIRPDDIVLDATLGGAGHAKALALLLGKKGMLIGIDADKAAVERARIALAPLEASRQRRLPTTGGPLTGLSAAKTRIHLEVGNFRNLKGVLNHCGVPGITKVLFDLGWSAYQLAAGKGFSFLGDEPLFMTYPEPDASHLNGAGGDLSVLTARQIVNSWKEESIADILYGWGEERYARRIARAIAESRRVKPIETARELGELIRKAVPRHYQRGRLHPATKSFQALRIAVNDEIGALKEGLGAAWEVLRPGGRIAVISFHSVEDREVKRMMMDWAKRGEGVRVTKSPIRPSSGGMLSNPRSRSAKLRVIEKV